MALVGGFGFAALTMTNTDKASAAGSGYTVGQSFANTGIALGTLNGELVSFPTSIQTVWLAGTRVADTYCVDLTKWGSNKTMTDPYRESSWGDSGIANMDKISWIVANGFPTLTESQLGSVAGVTGLFGLSKKEATMATQAAIWHFSNGWDLDMTKTVDAGGTFLNREINADHVRQVYTYLINNVKSATSTAGTPLTIDTSKAAVANGLYGPLTATTRDGVAAKITTNGSAQIVVNGASIGTSGSVASGAQFFLKVASTPTNVTVTATALTAMKAGTVLLPSGTTDQPMVVATGYQFFETTVVTVSVSDTLPPKQDPNQGQTDYSVTKSMVAPLAAVQPGETVTWNVVATNNGPGVSSGVTVLDKLPAGFTEPSATMQNGTCSVRDGVLTCASSGAIAAGEKRTVSITGKAPNAGCWTNTASVIPNEADTNTSNDKFTTPEVCVATQTPQISITKTVVPTGTPGPGATKTLTVTAGGTVDYYYQVKATNSTEPIKNVVVTDDKCTNPTYLSGDANGDKLLQVDETWLYKCSTSVAETVTSVGSVAGQGSVSNTPVTDKDSVVVTVTPALTAGIALDKKAGAIADANGNGIQDAGDTITYTFDVKNTGTARLSPVTLSDPKLGSVTCPKNALAPGEAMTCTAQPYSITADDVAKGHVINDASVQGMPPSPLTPPTASDREDTPITPAPALKLIKQMKDANGNGFAELGEKLTYTFTVTNTGNTMLAPVTISDAKLGLKDAACVTSLAPGATAPCVTTGSYTATQADVDAGKIVNDATATGTSPAGTKVSADSSVSTPTPTAAPAITLVKEHKNPIEDANHDGIIDAGDHVTYAFKVSNNGNATVNNVAITDPMLAGITITCAKTTLAPGESTDCTVTSAYTIKATDIVNGRVVNVATATATGPNDVKVSAEDNDVVIPQMPNTKLELVKKSALNDSNGNGAADEGETIDYTFEVKNTGNVTLSSVVVNDAKLGLSAAACVNTLAPGASAPCSAKGSYKVTKADIPAGSILNKATASAKSPQGTDVPSNESQTVTPTATSPNMDLKKSVEFTNDKDKDGKADEGDTLKFRFLVSNTGTIALSKIKIDDAMLTSANVAISCPGDTLAIGASMTCESANYTVTAADVEAGGVHNVATARATTPSGKETTSPKSETTTPADQHPMLALVKSSELKDSNGNAAADAGEKINYTFRVTNAGNVTVKALSIDDQMLATAKVAISCAQTTLKPGDETTCTAEPYTVTAADVEAGKIVNTATARGTTPSGGDVVSPKSERVTLTKPGTPLIDTPSLTLSKKGALKDDNGDGKATVGETVTFTFELTNTGTSDISGIRLSDPMLASAKVKVTCPGDALKSGKAMTCQADPYIVTSADAANGRVKNVATATSNGGSTTAPSEVGIQTTKVITTVVTGQRPTTLARTGGPAVPAAGIATLLLGGMVLLRRRAQ